MSDWTDLGLPCPLVDGYGYDRDIGILRSAVPAARPRQIQGWKDKRETYPLAFCIPRELLDTVETFFGQDAYSWFTMPLVNGDALGVADVTVRAVSDYTLTPYTKNHWKLEASFETQIEADEPDLTAHAYSTNEETCCATDDVQCCEIETDSPGSTDGAFFLDATDCVVTNPTSPSWDGSQEDKSYLVEMDDPGDELILALNDFGPYGKAWRYASWYGSWITTFYYVSEASPTTPILLSALNFAGATEETVWDAYIAAGLPTATLSGSSWYRFFIADSPIDDNSGGIGVSYMRTTP